MFDDHWYEHSTTQELLPQVTQSLRRPDPPHRPSLDSPRSSREIVRERPKSQKRNVPELPNPTILPRAKSYGDFQQLRGLENTCLGDDESKEVGRLQSRLRSPPKAHKLSRPKSRNDMKNTTNPFMNQRTLKSEDLRNELDFMRWYEDFEDGLQDASNDEYLVFLSTVQSQLWTCQRLLDTTDATLALLSSLKASFIAVENQTSIFQTQCEDLVTEEQRLESLSEQIGRGLAPFAELESIVSKLNRPGTDFVRTRSFTDMLLTLDWCLEDLGKHPSFKDAPIYLPRFRRCMTTAMTLIRNFIVASLKETSAEVAKRMAAKNITETTQSALLYARFRVNAPELRDLVGEIEKRCIDHEEYISLLNDCYKAYFASRQSLVAPLMAKRMNELATNTANANDLVAFARSSLSDARSVCNDEFELFFAYFSTGDKEVYAYLESICKPFYDRLRPKIAAETQLVKLCELCTLLQTRYMRDLEDPEVDPYDRSQFDFGHLIQTILQETQTRLVTGAQMVLKNTIEQFQPSAEDLEYPQKAKMQQKPKDTVAPATLETDESLGVTGEFDTEAVFQGWYPSLKKSIWLLSRIYRLVNPTVFGDIAHKIVHSCTISLIKGSQLLAKQKTPVDGHLFLIKHLLTLKEQIVAFDIEYLPSELGQLQQPPQATLSGTFWDVYMKGGLFTRDGILKLVSVGAGWTGGPVENMVDAKVELDATLRTAITSFTSHYASKMLAPLLDSSVVTTARAANYSASPYLGQPAASSIMNPNWQPQIPPHRITSPHSFRSPSPNPGITRSPSPLPQPAPLVFAPTSHLSGRGATQLMEEIKSNIEREVQDIRNKLQDYAVGDWRTKEALVGAVQELVIGKYEAFFAQLLQEASSSNNSAVISYRDVMDVETFTAWSGNVFGVGEGKGRPYGGNEGQGLGIGLNGEEDDDYTTDPHS